VLGGCPHPPDQTYQTYQTNEEEITMRRCTTVLATAAVAAVLGVTLTAQKTTEVHPGKGGSPHVKTAWVVDTANISIEYGRPSLKGREEA
jgi:hypothetical protein